MIKKNIFLIVVFPVLLFPFSQKLLDTSVTDKIDSTQDNKIEKNNYTTKDTIYILQDYLEKPWYKDFEVFLGAFLGGIIAASIAIYSVYKTNKNNLNIEKDKFQKVLYNNRARYCGNLFSIYSELITHTQLHKQKINEINFYLEKTAELKDITADEPFTPFPIDFLKESRRLILDFGDYRSSVLAFLSAYINKTVDINNFLILTKVRKSKQYFESEDDYVEGVRIYFNEIIKHLNAFKNVRFELLEDIWDDMNRFEQFLYFKKNAEQMINIISNFKVTDNSIEEMRKLNIDQNELEKLIPIKNEIFNNYGDFSEKLTEILDTKFFELNKDNILINCRYKTFNEL